jgi:hypothetical protein
MDKFMANATAFFFGIGHAFEALEEAIASDRPPQYETAL